MKRKIISLLLAAVMVCGIFAVAPLNAFADDTLPYVYTINDGQVCITGYTGNEQQVQIPATIDNLPVTAIGEQAFFGNTELRSVTMPDSVTTVGSDAFATCSQLQSVVLSSNLRTAGAGMFSNCYMLSSVNGVNYLETIPDGMFRNCYALNTFLFSPGISEIGPEAFMGCSNLTINQPLYGLQRIGNRAFAGCGHWNVSEPLQCLQSIGEEAFAGITFEQSFQIPETVTEIGNRAFGCESINQNMVYANQHTPVIDAFNRSADAEPAGMTPVKITVMHHTYSIPMVEWWGITTGWIDESEALSYEGTTLPARLYCSEYCLSDTADPYITDPSLYPVDEYITTQATIHVNIARRDCTQYIEHGVEFEAEIMDNGIVYHETRIMDLNPVGHSFINIPGTESTCYTEGMMPHWCCENCHRYFESDSDPYAAGYESETQFMTPVMHQLSYVESVPASCTQPGIRSHYCCDICGQCFEYDWDTSNPQPETYFEEAPFGHSLTYVPGTPADCLHEGMAEHWYCTNCGRYFDSDTDLYGEGYADETVFDIPPSSHDLVYVEGHPATCQEAGVGGHWYCNTCGLCFDNPDGTGEAHDASYYDIPPYSHDLIYVEGHPATCQEAGVGGHWYCNTCGLCFDNADGTGEAHDASYYDIPPSGHQLYYVDGTPASCTQSGIRSHYCCDICGQCFEYDWDTANPQPETYFEEAPFGHSLTYVPGTPADCLHEGMAEHWYCTNCGRYFDSDTDLYGEGYADESVFVTPCTPHNMLFYRPAREATCEQMGMREHWYCAACGLSYDNAQCTGEGHEETYFIIPQLNHQLSLVQARPATCAETGNHAYWRCDICGECFDCVNGVYMPCEDEHVFDIPCLPHTLTHVAAVQPTVDSAGNIEYWVCDECGKYFADSAGTQEITAQDTVLEQLVRQVGDFDGNGALTVQDATGIQRFLAEMVDEDDPDYAIFLQYGDFNGDGKVNVLDLTAIQRRLAGVE